MTELEWQLTVAAMEIPRPPSSTEHWSRYSPPERTKCHRLPDVTRATSTASLSNSYVAHTPSRYGIASVLAPFTLTSMISTTQSTLTMARNWTSTILFENIHNVPRLGAERLPAIGKALIHVSHPFPNPLYTATKPWS